VLTEGIEGDILMIADLEGDWREELITALPGELRIYHTNIPARDRRVTLMQDPLYRSYVAHRSMGYPQAPVPSFYLGE
jgi:rhamnogalacturonan endolyase